MVNEFEEFRKQYEKTYLRVRFEGTKDLQVVNVRECVGADEKRPYILFHNPVIGQTTVRWEDSKQEIDYEFPATGLFNHADNFYAFYRFPDRQWKKGISHGNVRIIDPINYFRQRVRHYQNFVSPKFNVDFHTLTSAFSNKYPASLDEAIQTVNRSDMIGTALNPVFGITKSPTLTTLLVLWKHLSMIGIVDPVARSIEVTERTFRQEVFDFLKRKQEYAWSIK